MAGTPCPYKGKIGAEAQKGWEENPEDIPSGSLLMADIKKKKVTPKDERTNHDYQTEETDPWYTESTD